MKKLSSSISMLIGAKKCGASAGDAALRINRCLLHLGEGTFDRCGRRSLANVFERQKNAEEIVAWD